MEICLSVTLDVSEHPNKKIEVMIRIKIKNINCHDMLFNILFI